jgi:hypothetical protein
LTDTANIPAPVGFTDGRPWLDQDPPEWVWPVPEVILAGDPPVRLKGHATPVGRVVSPGDGEEIYAELAVEPRIVEQLQFRVGAVV